jgi:hypothetical protein
LSIAGGVSFFVLLAIFPAITTLVSAYGLFFNPATIANDIGQLNDLVPANVLTIVHEQPLPRDIGAQLQTSARRRLAARTLRAQWKPCGRSASSRCKDQSRYWFLCLLKANFGSSYQSR